MTNVPQFASPDATEKELAAINQRISASAGHLEQITDRLEELNDRLDGPVPAGPNPTAPAEYADGMLGSIEKSLDRLAATIERASMAGDRLQRLA